MRRVCIWAGEQVELVGLGVDGELLLLVLRRDAYLVGHEPDLEQVESLVAGGVHLAVADAGAGGHVLEFAGDEGLAGAHGVLVFDGTLEDVGEDLHVAMGVLAEAHGRGDEVLVDDAEGAETHVRGIVVLGEGEGEVGVEPTVVGMAAFCCFPDGLHMSFTQEDEMGLV